MAVRSNPSLATGARGVVAGTVSNGATWQETIYLSVNGAAITGADTSTWQFNFRKDPESSSADLQLSTTGGTLTVTQGTDSTAIAIVASPSALATIEGDYIADLASKDTSGVITHWLHGIVTFIKEPVWV